MDRKKLVSIFAGIMAAIMLLSLLASIIPMAHAASSAEIRNEINDLKVEREQIKDQISNLEDEKQSYSERSLSSRRRKP